MSKKVVSISTLKGYFKRGKKPTETQFSNLIDAFHHKDEPIPQDKIDDLAETLSNKAETTAVDAKANADASDLGDENVAKWKEVLGVGELPENIATIDQNGALGNVHTKEQITQLLEGLTPPTLREVLEQGTYVPKAISFLYKGDDSSTNMGNPAGALGIDPKTYTFHFGKFNPNSTGYWNFQIGYSVLENNTTGAENTAVGHFALNANTTGSYNVAFGLNAGMKSVEGARNTFLGYRAGANMTNGNTITIVGANAGTSLNHNRFSLKDLTDIVPIMGKLVSETKNYYKMMIGYNETDQTITSGLSNFFGAGASENGPTRAVYSTLIGCADLNRVAYRNYNNLIFSNVLYGYGQLQIHNSLIWGNFMRVENSDNILAVHNGKSEVVPFSQALIYGKFEERWLKINGKLTLNPTHAPAPRNITKVAVAGDDGTLTFLTLGQLKGLLENAQIEAI